jgi:nucleoside 2-deoxyribosyltransferase
MTIKLYISGALIGSSDLFRARSKYEACASSLRDAGFCPYLPHQNTDPQLAVGTTAEDVFSTDVQALMSSDAVIAFLDEPSHGVGAEVAICIARKIPVIALAPTSVRVSRFILGMIERSAATLVVRYSTLDELISILPGKVQRVLELKETAGGLGLEALLQQART